MRPLRRSSISLSARYDDNSDFDDVATYRATSAWTTESTQTRLHASYGTGQKAPTFVERFGFFPGQFVGNPDLEPETSTGWEAGIEQPLFESRISLGGTSKRRGMEVTARARVTQGLRVSGSYTYLNATEPDRVTGDDAREIRRPRHIASLNGDWRFLDNQADVNLNLAYVGDRTDVFFGPPTFDEVVDLDSYYLASVAVSYRLAGLGAYAGLGWSF